MATKTWVWKLPVRGIVLSHKISHLSLFNKSSLFYQVHGVRALKHSVLLANCISLGTEVLNYKWVYQIMHILSFYIKFIEMYSILNAAFLNKPICDLLSWLIHCSDRGQYSTMWNTESSFINRQIWNQVLAVSFLIDKMEVSFFLFMVCFLSWQTESAGIQRAQIQKELWRIQDVMEGLSKHKQQRGTTEMGRLASLHRVCSHCPRFTSKWEDTGNGITFVFIDFQHLKKHALFFLWSVYNFLK